MFLLFFITAALFFFVVFFLEWSGDYATLFRIFLFVLGVAHWLNAFKVLFPSLNWGF